MKKKISIFCAVVALIPLSVLAANSPLYVKVRQAKIRSQPKQWAPSVSSLNYGDRVDTLSEEDGAWFKVKKGGSSGYLHGSAVSERAVVFKSTKSVGKGGDDKDVILAGKGFNKEVENSYAQKKPDLNYREVDKMERISVGDTELASFIKEGQLEGGQ